MVIPPGDAVIIHWEAGKPLNSTAPVAEEQVGCVVAPIIGIAGTNG